MPRRDRLPGMSWLRIAVATFKRDLWMATSYRVGFLMMLGGSVFNIAGVYFLGQAIGDDIAPPDGRYGDDYFGFAVVGVAFSAFMAIGLTGISSRVREGQMMGTLELMLLSPNPLGVVLGSSTVWSHVQGLITLLVYLVAAIVLGMDLSQANWPLAAVSLVLSVLAFNALGLIAASVVIIIKQGNPVGLLIGMASVLLAGVLYPTSVLPEWMQTLGQFLPLTHTLDLMRVSLLGGGDLAAAWPSLAWLIALTVVFMPLGLWASGRAVRIALVDGSLSQY
jgi:ABC-2 type transport system permease protein